MEFTTELIVPPDTAFASLVNAFAADVCARAELAKQPANDFTSAATEAFQKIVEQAMAESRDRIRIIATVTASDLRIRIRERGLPLDGATLSRDVGWQGIAQRVDALHWHSRGTSGTEVELVAAHAPHANTEAPPQTNEDEVPQGPPQNYTVRRFQPQDASAVSRAFYLTYGYHYDFPAVYEPRRLTALNAANQYISIVAIGEDGELAGHYALSREENQPIADGCGAIVLPAHRGRDLLNLLRKGMEEEAQRLGLAAYYSEPVTDHDRTQRASEKFGAKPTGITLGCAPQSFLAKHMELSATAQRQSCMLYFKLLKPAGPRTIYAPTQHREMIERIYNGLGIETLAGSGKAASNEAGIRITMNRGDATATIEVFHIGEDSGAALRQAITDLKTFAHLGAIYVHLPLDDPGTPALTEVAESCGLFFSGVGPWMLAGRDALLLQLPLTPIDLSALTVVGEFGNELRDYIAVSSKKAATSRSIPA